MWYIHTDVIQYDLCIYLLKKISWKYNSRNRIIIVFEKFLPVALHPRSILVPPAKNHNRLQQSVGEESSWSLLTRRIVGLVHVTRYNVGKVLTQTFFHMVLAQSRGTKPTAGKSFHPQLKSIVNTHFGCINTWLVSPVYHTSVYSIIRGSPFLRLFSRLSFAHFMRPLFYCWYS